MWGLEARRSGSGRGLSTSCDLLRKLISIGAYIIGIWYLGPIIL